jgi:hypothetical protein
MNAYHLTLLTNAARAHWLSLPDKYQPRHWELERAIGVARSHLEGIDAPIDTTQPATSEASG